MKINAKGKTAEILLYEDIGGWFGITSKMFADALKGLGDVTDITLRINSQGGEVFEGIAIYNYLKSHKARVTVEVDGLAASIASIIAMAGDTIRMADNGWLMIHDPWIVTAGTSGELRQVAETMDGIRDTLLDTYMKRATVSRDEVSEMMAAETWLTAARAQEVGLIDEVTGAMQLAASVHRGWFRNAPADLPVVDTPQPSARVEVARCPAENARTRIRLARMSLGSARKQ